MKTRLPVRSALFKQRTGGLVVRWVTTSEYPLLYVFAIFFFLSTRASSPNTSHYMLIKLPDHNSTLYKKPLVYETYYLKVCAVRSHSADVLLRSSGATTFAHLVREGILE